MKRRFLFLLLTALLLCGCVKEPPPQATAGPTQAVCEETVEPTGYYDPENRLEQDTAGAVRCYPLDRLDCYGIVPMGDDLLLFSGLDGTTLTRLSGSTLYISAAANLDCAIYPGDCSTLVSEKGVTYYDELRRELVYLDGSLKEVNRISLPENITGQPILSADRKLLYYCTDVSLRVIDLDTGFDRLLREMHYSHQTLLDLHCADTLIACEIHDEYGNWRYLFLSVETGATVYETEKELSLWTAGDRYFAVCYDAAYQELLTGIGEQPPQALLYGNYHVTAEPLLDIGGAVTITDYDETHSTVLNYYDLDSGRRTASLELPAQNQPWSLRSSPDGQYIWFLSYDAAHNSYAVCRWEPELTPTGDETVYLDERRSFENPDLDGLAACAETAGVLSEKYGVQILLWTDATAFPSGGYTLTPEYQVPVIRHGLELLDQALANYPAGFLKKAAESSESGAIRICLVRSIAGNSEGETLSYASGLQFWDEAGNSYVALDLYGSLEQNLYHELFHIIDSRVLCSCTAYDDWEKLNPAGFEYDNDYVSYFNREDYELMQGTDQAFIDAYSMTFPREDRARIMEYAMMPDSAYCFASETMQAKLRKLCVGIRVAFDLENAQEAFLWEQYLAEPLAP